MSAQKQVFISHTDDQVGNAMQDVVQRAFDGKVRSFNTSRAARGLAAGVRIDEGLLEGLQSSDLFLSLWTPGAVARPAWMSWELGVAAAMRATVLVGRALGVDVGQLPLGLGARFANDLGDEDSLVRLVEDISAILDVDSDTARVREHFSGPRHSVFRARHSSAPKLSISVHRKYFLIENVSTTELDDLRVVPVETDTLGVSVVKALDRALHKDGRKLSASGRLVATLPDGGGDDRQPPDLAILRERDLIMQAEWRAPEIGREWAEVTIFGRDSEA
ncbi:hypothetical protein ACFP2T_09690 [Plantactinospora solaniradicis]|uniref:TIR domain-containing protein n=1 Tax=Plantactinospora solaniradicis TaxID=1723736 RepID=A0ABW1K4W8_9ACTN